MSFSDYLENALLDHIFINGDYTSPTNLYVALTKSTIDDADTGSTIPTELSGGNYARVKCNTWTTAADGSLDNDIKIEFAEASNNWGTATDFAVCDHSSTGEIIGFGALSVPKKIGTGDTAKFATNSLKCSLN